MAAIDSGGGGGGGGGRGDHMFCHKQSGGTTFRSDQLKYDRTLFSIACQSSYAAAGVH